MRKPLDITGQRFGRLVAIRPTDKRIDACVVWECKCDCGNVVNVSVHDLKRGDTKSCGCIRYERAIELIKKIDQSTERHICDYKKQRNNTSGYKGVSWYSRRNKWVATITYHCRDYHLLYSTNINDCIAVRAEAEEAVRAGNFPEWIAAYRNSKY